MLKRISRAWMVALALVTGGLTTQAGYIVSQDGLTLEGGAWTEAKQTLAGWEVTDTGATVFGVVNTVDFLSSGNTTLELGNYGTGTRLGRDWFRSAASSWDTNGGDLDENYSWYSTSDTPDFSVASQSSLVFSDTAGMTNLVNWCFITMDHAPINYTGYTVELGAVNEAAIKISWVDADVSGTRSAGDLYTIEAILYATGADTFDGKPISELNAMLPQPAPNGLSAVAAFNSVSLDWNDVIDPDFDFYKVYRSIESGTNYVEIAPSVAVSSYTDSTAVNGTTYYYVVTSVNDSSSESAYSPEVSARPTAVPVGLVAIGDDNQVDLDWSDSLNPAFDFYTVYRSTTSGTNYVAIASNLTVSAYSDLTAVNETTYYYTVSETDTLAVESGMSDEVSALPMPPVTLQLDLGQLIEGNQGYTNKYNPVQTVGAADNWNDILEVYDPADNSGRMTRFYLRFTETQSRLNGNIWNIPSASSSAGYIGSEVIGSEDPETGQILFPNLGAAYNVPLNTIMWYVMPYEQDSFANQTPYNELAFGLRFTDVDTNGVKSLYDTMEVVGVLYTQGTDTLVGMTADDLTELLMLDANAFETWAQGYGLSGANADPDADPDEDGADNLAEYAFFGGDPTNALVTGQQPWMAGNLEYIYQVIDDSSLQYEIVTTTDLVHGGGTVGLTPAGSGPGETGYTVYTNTVDTTASTKGFLTLEITQQ